MCNNTGNRVSVALAYTDGQNWASEGWWNLKSLDCVTLLRGALAAQYYYVYAMDERGGEWKGKAFMCTTDREFKIDGRQDCFTARLRANRLLRGRHRQGREELDGAAHRPGEFRRSVRGRRPASIPSRSTRSYGRSPCVSVAAAA